MIDFTAWFSALWPHAPFPWQSMLAERVSRGDWPKVLDLPTAAGKTACIDIALYALAAQADLPTAERTAPRRIWFVVDRRIVVDEAFARAEHIARKLHEAADGPLREIADRLRQISGTERPLAVARLRGGVLKDDGWARLPSQPAIITSTVDQLGSRLLFRSYGASQLTASIFAGLAANDSLIVLDEAHCSVPFLQTLRAIETYRGARWCEASVPTPFSFVMLSATPPADVAASAVFPGTLREAALDHPILEQRLNASKLAELVEVKLKRQESSEVADQIVERALRLLRDGRVRIGVMVNRVAMAQALATALSTAVGDEADVVLLTGRIRPFERDRLVDRWKPYLRASSPDGPLKPIIMVSTQCLEVGADFSFDALITEAASLDALRQRFGRLDRMGTAGTSAAVIVIRDRDASAESEEDPIYGTALAATWKFLKEHVENNIIDFGFEALRGILQDVDDLSAYRAPTSDAPILLPAHLDLLCQTSPIPTPEPDVSLFLHGKDRGAPEVQVLWRTDLDPEDTRAWLETVALCAPVNGEMLSVPLYRLRRFLADVADEDDGDVEGVPQPAADTDRKRIKPCLVWRGRERSKVPTQADQIFPGDVVVLPSAYGISALGQSAPEEWVGQEGLDLWEPALAGSGRAPAVRLNRRVLKPWTGSKAIADLLAIVEEQEIDRTSIGEVIDSVVQPHPAEETPAGPPAWWIKLLKTAFKGSIERHPAGGVVLVARASLAAFRRAEPDLFADDDDLTSMNGAAVSLDEHSELVKRTVAKLADRCLPEPLRSVLVDAAYWHDVGKLDARFQVLLHQGDELAAMSAPLPLAKSEQVPTSPARRRAIREASRLPDNFRHEMLSAQLAQRVAEEFTSDAADLFLHLIASHHGYARPFAPVCQDSTPPAVAGQLGDMQLALTSEQRMHLTPAHHIGSGHAERFWQLTRCHGWWGLAYLEALLRMGDWYASGFRLTHDSTAESLDG